MDCLFGHQLKRQKYVSPLIVAFTSGSNPPGFWENEKSTEYYHIFRAFFMDTFFSRSHLKIKILVQDQGGAEF
jgi:hypothetical protein